MKLIIKFPVFLAGCLALVAGHAQSPVWQPLPADSPSQVGRPGAVDRTQPAAPNASQEAAARTAAQAAAQTVPGNLPLNSLAGFGADYRIGPNDLVDVEVYGVPELKRTVRVNSSGLVSLALVGNVPIGGLTTQHAEEAIAKRYAEKYLQDPQIAVFIREFTTQRLTIEGAVVRPGIYPLTGQITLLRAIALAGGGAQASDLSQIMIFRTDAAGAKSTAVFDLEKIRKGETPDPEVKAEDVIVVRRDAARTLFRDSIVRDIFDTINPFSIFRGP